MMPPEEKTPIPLSVIIPVGPGETCWRKLLAQIDAWDYSPEVIVVFSDGDEANAAEHIVSPRRRRIVSPRGRAVQMNSGARVARNSRLWFLHADSQVAAAAANAMWDAAQQQQDAIHYLKLAFAGDGPRMVKLNAWGARFRSRWLGIPFGDQGICLSRTRFVQLGEFDTSASYGEDHLLMWRAHQQRVSVKQVNGTIVTSARKYAERGWWRTTRQHFLGTWKQAVPEWFKTWIRRPRPANVASVAVVVFVKTPGLSPVKTRLAAEIGVDAAEECYRLSMKAVEAVVRRVCEVTPVKVKPYWAVAEPEGMSDPLWRDFDRVAQPAGGLGERLAGIYEQLIARHRGVVFLGADAPQLSPNTLEGAGRLLLEGFPFVIGPADDGGFYLFGGAIPLPRSVWTDVEYSSDQTCKQLMRQLEARGEILEWTSCRDIDRLCDLKAVIEQMSAVDREPEGGWLPEQLRFRDAFKPLLEMPTE